jgi:hypothetical protein
MVENDLKPRWGIVLSATLLFMCTLVVVPMLGKIASGYYAVWLMIGWYGYKGKIQEIKITAKYSIWVNLALILFVYIFLGGNGYDSVVDTKNKSALALLIMLTPSVLIYLFYDKKLKEKNNHPIKGKESQNIENNESTKKTDIDNISNNLANNQQVNQFQPQSSPQFFFEGNEAQIYEKIYEELESKNFDKALWIRLFAKNDGDEKKTKVQYVNERFAVINGGIISHIDIAIEKTNEYATNEINNNENNSLQTIKTKNIENRDINEFKNKDNAQPKNNSDELKNENFPFSRFSVLDTMKVFEVDSNKAKQILSLNIKKVNGSLTFNGMSFNNLRSAINHAEKKIPKANSENLSHTNFIVAPNSKTHLLKIKEILQIPQVRKSSKHSQFSNIECLKFGFFKYYEYRKKMMIELHNGRCGEFFGEGIILYDDFLDFRRFSDEIKLYINLSNCNIENLSSYIADYIEVSDLN